MRLVSSESPENAQKTLSRNFGIDASAHIPRHIESVDISAFDVIVAIDDPGGNRIYAAQLCLSSSAKVLAI
jgi:protein-tyrosine-phosphatase